MTRKVWVKEYAQIYGPKTREIAAAPTWLLELAVRYGRLKATGGLRTQTEFRMQALTAALDEAAVKAVSDVWQYMVVQEIAEAKRAKRKAPEPPKHAVGKRPTAAAAVLALLRERPVRPDAQIIEAVHAATFSDGFNKQQLAWYKSQMRQGRLKGQDGPESIEEPKAGLDAKQAKPARPGLDLARSV